MAESLRISKPEGARTCSMADPMWLVELSKSLNGLYRKGMFCDTTLMTSDGQVFSAHACMLAASSPVLYKVMENTKQGDRMVTLNNISKGAWNAILDFIYQGQVDIPERDLREVMEAANLLQMTALVKLCENLHRYKAISAHPDYPHSLNRREIETLSGYQHELHRQQQQEEREEEEEMEDTTKPSIASLTSSQDRLTQGYNLSQVLPPVNEGMPNRGPREEAPFMRDHEPRDVLMDIRTGEIPPDSEETEDEGDQDYDSEGENESETEALDLSSTARTAPAPTQHTTAPFDHENTDSSLGGAYADGNQRWVHINEDDVLDLSGGKEAPQASDPQVHNMILDLSHHRARQERVPLSSPLDRAHRSVSAERDVTHSHTTHRARSLERHIPERNDVPQDLTRSGSVERVISAPMVRNLHPKASLKAQQIREKAEQQARLEIGGFLPRNKISQQMLSPTAPEPGGGNQSDSIASLLKRKPLVPNNILLPSPPMGRSLSAERGQGLGSSKVEQSETESRPRGNNAGELVHHSHSRTLDVSQWRETTVERRLSQTSTSLLTSTPLTTTSSSSLQLPVQQTAAPLNKTPVGDKSQQEIVNRLYAKLQQRAGRGNEDQPSVLQTLQLNQGSKPNLTQPGTQQTCQAATFLTPTLTQASPLKAHWIPPQTVPLAINKDSTPPQRVLPGVTEGLPYLVVNLNRGVTSGGGCMTTLPFASRPVQQKQVMSIPPFCIPTTTATTTNNNSQASNCRPKSPGLEKPPVIKEEPESPLGEKPPLSVAVAPVSLSSPRGEASPLAMACGKQTLAFQEQGIPDDCCGSQVSVDMDTSGSCSPCSPDKLAAISASRKRASDNSSQPSLSSNDRAQGQGQTESPSSKRRRAGDDAEMDRARQLMRPWLVSQVESKHIEGLEWMDVERTLMRIPWKHASRTNWEIGNDACLYMRWAKHTGKYLEGRDEPAPKRWKANFRCALNSLPDVIEVKEQSNKKGQNAFKVYKLLPSKVRKVYPSGQSSSKDQEACSREGDSPETGFTKPLDVLASAAATLAGSDSDQPPFLIPLPVTVIEQQASPPLPKESSVLASEKAAALPTKDSLCEQGVQGSVNNTLDQSFGSLKPFGQQISTSKANESAKNMPQVYTSATHKMPTVILPMPLKSAATAAPKPLVSTLGNTVPVTKAIAAEALIQMGTMATTSSMKDATGNSSIVAGSSLKDKMMQNPTVLLQQLKEEQKKKLLLKYVQATVGAPKLMTSATTFSGQLAKKPSDSVSQKTLEFPLATAQQLCNKPSAKYNPPVELIQILQQVPQMAPPSVMPSMTSRVLPPVGSSGRPNFSLQKSNDRMGVSASVNNTDNSDKAHPQKQVEGTSGKLQPNEDKAQTKQSADCPVSKEKFAVEDKEFAFAASVAEENEDALCTIPSPTGPSPVRKTVRHPHLKIKNKNKKHLKVKLFQPRLRQEGSIDPSVKVKRRLASKIISRNRVVGHHLCMFCGMKFKTRAAMTQHEVLSHVDGQKC